MDTVFDVAVTHARTIGGCTCNQCVAIAGADVVILKDKVIKKSPLLPISTQHWIASFNPKELCDNETAFFLFVGNWHKQTQAINQHMKSFHLHNVFMVVQMGCHQRQHATGALQFQVDAGGNPVHDASGNPIPEMEDCVQEIGNLFDTWHNLAGWKSLRVAASVVNLLRMLIVRISHGLVSCCSRTLTQCCNNTSFHLC